MTELFKKGLVKITFQLHPGDWEGLESEGLWATELNAGEYQIRNSPFYVYGISAEDVVYAREEKGAFIFVKVIAPSGHSTYRLLLKEGEFIDSPNFLKKWQPLQAMGCTFEQAKIRWLSIDVPAGADIYGVYFLLEEGEKSGVWSFEEAHCGHMVKDGRASEATERLQ